ncbi:MULTISPECIES: hypothetical protein [Eubacterium]|uniref:Uncharacterized protein n=1 Tax=Eubacterium barkeri TaxID=1528 RepID=A0A1H3DJD7_EUBBA|nr:hypothetical protein [Eubacterium barkeri]SDX66525.1 hypothetical protein SAMN04488579_10529 [Eubacterium barkeri]
MKVIDAAQMRIMETYVLNAVPETVQKDNIAGGYRELSTKQLCDIAWNLFCLYTKDPVVSDFRKLLTREQ